ncbi:MAG: AraC family transcriptional regulator [Ruminococcaceae bacterium]|nr:AraC family transcriptional regulator [Oscillospiraceae bacterium]
MYRELINSATEQYPFLIEHTDVRYIPHFHRETEIVYVRSGELTCTLGADCYTMRAGDICVIPPNVVHNLYTEQASRSFVVKAYPAPNLTDIFLFHPIITADTPLHARLEQFILEIMREHSARPLCHETAVNTLLNLFFLLLIRNFEHHEVGSKLLLKSTHDSRFLTEINSFLDTHYAEPFSLSTVAAHFNYTPNYFCRIFKQTIGLTFWEYYTLYRLEKAVQFMSEHPKANISTVAAAAGFKNVRSFNESFKRFYRCTPSQHRKTLS